MIWSVMLGSAVGGALRFLIGSATLAAPGSFPAGTLLINVVGSFLLGFLVRYGVDAQALSPVLRVGLTAGFCGGFTTFSAFSGETLVLIEAGDLRRTLLYVALSVGLSVLAAAFGMALARAVSDAALIG